MSSKSQLHRTFIILDMESVHLNIVSVLQLQRIAKKKLVQRHHREIKLLRTYLLSSLIILLFLFRARG